MAVQKKPVKIKQIKQEILKEVNFIKSIFAFYSAPNQNGIDESKMDFEITTNNKQKDTTDLPKRAHSIVELEEKLEKMKSQNKFNLKSKLIKKSLSSKLNKKIKKKERVKLNKNKIKEVDDNSADKEIKIKTNINQSKPIFNNEGKLVFSKFDFAHLGHKEKAPKAHKDPKKKLDELKQQEQKVQELTEKDSDKAKDLKEKIAWKNILQKAEGQKVKDDPILLKKSIKRQEQKKKVSKKQWENRIKTVEDKKDERQKKRKDNIMKKKKEKKAKIVKASVKRGRVVL